MICMALPLFAAGLCLDREPGAPWVKFHAGGQGPVYIDPTSVKDEGDGKTVRLLDMTESDATSDIYLDLSVSCAKREAVIIRLTDAKSGKTQDISPADRKPADPGHPMMLRLIDFVCEGKPLK